MRHALPAISNTRSFPEAGVLMSYGASNIDADRLGGVYVGRVLKGDNPADLPVQQLVKVELIVNLVTAKALGLNMPLTPRPRRRGDRIRMKLLRCVGTRNVAIDPERTSASFSCCAPKGMKSLAK
jgi:ABC-type uncharacterized transport system substrate-binding protein